jgi:hypothetical protein
MDENASRAVFLGASLFVAVLTITLILNFYSTAKESASVVNRHDIANTENRYLNNILKKQQITGLELRYLLNYCVNDDRFDIKVFASEDEKTVGAHMDLSYEHYWADEYQKKLDSDIRPNYNYSLEVDELNTKYKINAIFKY